MAEKEMYEASGFLFHDRLRADEALEEEKKILYIRTRLKRDDPESMLVIYNRLIKGSILKTPPGFIFLKELRDTLLSAGIDSDALDPVPWTGGGSEREIRELKKTVEALEDETGEQKKKISFLRWAIVLLVAAMIALVILTLGSENPNILNYETALQNRYSTWEQELKEREDRLREREQAILDGEGL